MLSAAPILLPAVAAEELKAYLRIVGADEDALAARLMRSAAELCERFTGQALVARSFVETVQASSAWTRLAGTPLRAITAVEALGAEATVLPSAAYAVDIDANGDGWVRLTAPVDAPRLRVTFEAGMGAEWNALPEPLRQGAVRLAAHFYAERDEAEGAGPPAAVTALWRPYRRMRLR
ncbi:MAG TPA: hypothetical protein VGD10_01940 [Allosphingosinicella sp.]|uniref:head-tail connector protein n=1 Tax=Allosphingosinicella sp. TaxID=2823234 RepID=UPI002EDB52A2